MSKVNLKAKFKRICGSNEDTIELVSIVCDTNPCTALMVVDNVINNDEFMNDVTEAGTVFDICDDGECIEVGPCTECSDICESAEYVDPFEYLLSYAYTYLNSMRCLHWNAKGNNFDKLHNLTSNDYIINRYIDELAELCVQHNGSVHDSAYFMKCVEPMVVDSGFTYEEGIVILQNHLQNFICAMRLRYNELDKSIQSMLDNWIFECEQQANYLLARPQL